MRTCVACRTSRAKGELVRVVRSPDGAVAIDPTGTAPGRGAYLCDDPACWRLALKRSSLQRGLGVALAPAMRADVERRGGIHGA